jgi:hypothetical protein
MQHPLAWLGRTEGAFSVLAAKLWLARMRQQQIHATVTDATDCLRRSRRCDQLV